MHFRVLVVDGRYFKINSVDFIDYRFGKGYFKMQGLILQPAAVDPLALTHCVHKESKA